MLGSIYWEILRKSNQGICIFNCRSEKIYMNDQAREIFLIIKSEFYQQIRAFCHQIVEMFNTTENSFFNQSGVLRDSSGVINYICFSLRQGERAFICVVFDYHPIEKFELHYRKIFTPREKQILQAIAHGKTNKEISELLWISIETVKSHIRNLFAKTGVSSRAELIGEISSGTSRRKQSKKRTSRARRC
jgi:DNA-binding CsgD family transcriptional regulator